MIRHLLGGATAPPPSPRLRPWLAVVTAILVLAGCGGAKNESTGDAAAESGDAGTGSAIGSTAHAFTLPDLEGKTVSSASFAGKVVILDFWATWCPPCRQEMPHLVRLQSKLRDQGLRIVGLSLDAGGAGDVAPFAEEHNVNFTMLLANDELARAFEVTFVPTMVILDRKGTIVKRFVGFTPPEVIEAAVAPYLATTS